MLSCKEVTVLLSKAQDARLAWHERLAVRLHLLYCRGCARLKTQLAFLHRAARHGAAAGVAETSGTTLPAEARRRIARALDERR